MNKINKTISIVIMFLLLGISIIYSSDTSESTLNQLQALLGGNFVYEGEKVEDPNSLTQEQINELPTGAELFEGSPNGIACPTCRYSETYRYDANGVATLLNEEQRGEVRNRLNQRVELSGNSDRRVNCPILFGCEERTINFEGSININGQTVEGSLPLEIRQGTIEEPSGTGETLVSDVYYVIKDGKKVVIYSNNPLYTEISNNWDKPECLSDGSCQTYDLEENEERGIGENNQVVVESGVVSILDENGRWTRVSNVGTYNEAYGQYLEQNNPEAGEWGFDNFRANYLGILSDGEFDEARYIPQEFGFEFNVIDEFFQFGEDQICLEIIDGYASKTEDNGGGVTSYTSDVNNVQIRSDIRAQRTSITPDNKIGISLSYFIRAPEEDDIDYLVSIFYRQNGEVKNFPAFNQLKSLKGGGYDTDFLNINEFLGDDISGIDENSFVIKLKANYASTRNQYLLAEYPVLSVEGDYYEGPDFGFSNSDGNSQGVTQSQDPIEDEVDIYNFFD